VPLFNRRRANSASDQYNRRENSMVPRWTRPPERNTAEWIDMFSKSPRLAVVNRIASDLSFCSGRLYQVDGNGEEREMTSHPFLDFFDNCNPLYEYSSAAIWQLHEIYLLLKGEGYFIIERDAIGRPAELWPVPIHWVYMTPYLNHPLYSIRTTSGSIIEVPVEDMFIQKTLNPLDPTMRGLGEAESLSDEVETDEYAAKFQKRFFYNDATPNVVISMPGSSDEQRKRFRTEWLERFQGVFKAHGIATVGGETQVHRLGDHMKDLDMVEGRKFLRDASLEHFGMPREIMGITENSNRSTAEAAQFIYAQNVLTPRLVRREEAVNKQIIPAFGDDLVWRYDDIVPRNVEFDKTRALEGWNAGILLKDEARDLLDFAPAKTGGNVYKSSFSDTFIGEDEDPVEITAGLAAMQYNEPEDTRDTRDTQDTINVENDAGKSAAIEIEDPEDDSIEILDAYGEKASGRRVSLSAAERSEVAALRECGATFEVAMMKFFRAQTRLIAAALGETTKADNDVWVGMSEYFNDDGSANYEAWNLLDAATQEGLARKFASSLIDWTKENATLQKIFEPLWRQTYGTGAAHAQKLYGVQAVNRPELVSTAKLRGGQRIAHIQQVTKDRIGQIVYSGIEHGDSTKKIAASILEDLGGKPGDKKIEARAKLIARQEATTSLTAGQHDMMYNAGAMTKTWHHRPQKNPRDGTPPGTADHVELDGVERQITEKFLTNLGNKLEHPRDPTAPAEEVINCRCYLTYGGF